MKTRDLPYDPIEGRTYTLFGTSDSTSGYYRSVSALTDQLTGSASGDTSLLDRISRLSKHKTRLRRLMKKPLSIRFESSLLHLLHAQLQQFTKNTGSHLKDLPVLRLWDRRLVTTREQYHLYMIEIELTNRLFRDQFQRADRKIALMPYCLQDFSVNCKSSVKGFDYQCNHCSGKCFENRASIILKKQGIEPYIWRDLDFRKLAAATFKKGEVFAVFGIACIPELVWGMRKCRKHGIPVMGLPLNANRCVRWFGEFFPNSVDLKVLEDLVKVKQETDR